MFDTNYFTKIATVGLIIFLILIFLRTLSFINALLLTLIIATSIMIVDNLQVFVKVDCTSCKVENFENILGAGSLVPNIDEPIFTNTNTNFETTLPQLPTTPTVSTLLSLSPKKEDKENKDSQNFILKTLKKNSTNKKELKKKIMKAEDESNEENDDENDDPNVLDQTDTPEKVHKLDYMSDYVDYQINGEEDADMKQSLKNFEYKLSAGDQSLTVPYLKDSQNYYQDIYRRGINNIEPDELVKANLKYGTEYNYLGPLNFGMSNRAFSYVMPNNWNTVQAVPPVCAINKKLKSVVYPTLHTSNYASWANLEEFDRATRFTGNQQINIDYIKNVLNNPYV